MKNAIAFLCVLLLSMQIYATPRIAPSLSTQIKATQNLVKTKDQKNALYIENIWANIFLNTL